MKDKKKIVQVIYSGFGGHGTIAFGFIKGDVEKDFSHILIFYGIEEVSFVYQSFCLQNEIPYYFVSKKRGLDVASWRLLFKIFQMLKPDFILNHSPVTIFPTFIFRLFSKTAIIFSEHQNNFFKTKKEWVFSAFCQLLVKKITVVNDVYLQEMKTKLGFIFNSKKTKVVATGIDLRLVASFPAIKERFQMKDKLTVLMASRINLLRNHELLICLVEGNNRVEKLLIAGDGEGLNQLKKRVKKSISSDRIQFLGLLNEQDLLQKLHEVDVYIHSSKAETMSNSIMQAMASGLPILASKISGIEWMIIDGVDGILFNENDLVDLSSKFDSLVKCPELREKLAVNAQKKAFEEFDSRLYFKKIMNEFQGLS